MLTYEDLIALVFRWLDVAVIAAGVIYGVKCWVIPFLKEEKRCQQDRWTELEHKVAAHTDQVHQLDRQIVHDKLQVVQLQKKALLWQAVSAQEEITKKRYQEELIVRLKEHNEVKNRYIAQLSQQKYVAQEAFKQAESEIREAFNDPDIANRGLQKALDHLKKNVI